MIILFGPTSSGKTSLALQLCRDCGAEIVSADSRQVYQEMDIGTGKLPLEYDRSIQKQKKRWIFDGISVWGYDLATPNESFSAYDFAVFARQKIAEIRSRNHIPLLVGGTGFFIDVCTGLMDISGNAPNEELRASLSEKSAVELCAELQKLNPERAKTIDTHNRHRIIRAIEIELSKEKDRTLPPLSEPIRVMIGLTSDRSTLYTRVDRWVDQIWNPLLSETEQLIKTYPNSSKLHGIVYRSALCVLGNNDTQENAKQQAKYDLHAYIRRQSTWFRKYHDARLFDRNDSDCYTKVRHLIQSKEEV